MFPSLMEPRLSCRRYFRKQSLPLFSELCLLAASNRESLETYSEVGLGVRGEDRITLESHSKNLCLFSRLRCTNIWDICIIIFVSWQYHVFH